MERQHHRQRPHPAALLPTLLVLCLIGALGCGAGRPATVQYHGLRPTDPNGRAGLRNPERGFRIETYIAETDGARVMGPAHHLIGTVSEGYSEDWWLLDTARYADHGLTLAQTYCYLTEFANRPISESKLALLQRSFDNLRAHGLKALLRFAYEKNMSREGGPRLDTILRHLDQLGPIIRANLDVIYVMQAGFIGAWGEWHSATNISSDDHAAQAAIVAKILEVLPPERMTQVRVPKYKRWVLTQPVIGDYQFLTEKTAFSGLPSARIGFHDDSFLVDNTDQGTWREGPFYANPGNPEFDYWTIECPYLAVDGEMDWRDRWGATDGLRAAVRLRLHHYGSLSIAHSFSEREGNHASIDDWMETPLTLAQAREAKLPVSDGYFSNESGRDTPRTQFEYIRDHLGYRIELRSATYSKSARRKDKLSVELDLVNRGFAVPYNPRSVCLVLISEDESVREFKVDNADPRTWQPYRPGDETFTPLVHRIAAEIEIPDDLAPAKYRLGLWLPDAAPSIRKDPRYAIRVANRDAPWWQSGAGEYGVNLLGSVTVK